MFRLVISTLLIVVGFFWPGKLESKDLIWYQPPQYPCIIMKFQNWDYVLEEPGGKITKLENISSKERIGVKPKLLTEWSCPYREP